MSVSARYWPVFAVAIQISGIDPKMPHVSDCFGASRKVVSFERAALRHLLNSNADERCTTSPAATQAPFSIQPPQSAASEW